MEQKIDLFRGENFFLSNFYDVEVTYNGLTFKNSEAAFQAQKTLSQVAREAFTKMTAMESKRRGKMVVLRDDWDLVKEQIMYEICVEKFKNPVMRAKLLATGDRELIEGNTHGDRIWGQVNGYGENKLGKILMRIRSEIRKEQENVFI
jgi:ribA/ribD-fused uncharacterized protein